MAHTFKIRKRTPRRIEIFVDRIEQMFNSMDPSPFQEKDLDHDAEEFIYDWWPLRHLGKIYQALSRMPVELRTKRSIAVESKPK